MRASDYYPDEFCKRIALLPPKEQATQQQSRLIDLIEDKEVAAAARTVLNQLPDDCKNTSEDVMEVIENFWHFLEDAAAIPDLQPYGSKLRDEGPAEFPFEKKDMVRELTSAKGNAQKLRMSLKLIAPTIQLHFPIEETRVLMQTLDRIVAVCAHEHHKLTAKNNGADVFPSTTPKAGKNNWSNWVLNRIGHQEAIRISRRDLPLIMAIHRVLMDRSEPIEVGAAKQVLDMTANVRHSGREPLEASGDWSTQLELQAGEKPDSPTR
jgi:hypothetical protein